MRTIVIADIHAQPHLLDNVLEHAGYDNEKDRLIIAGDILDIGTHVEYVLERVEALGAEVLVGNHDLAVTIGQKIRPQNIESWGYSSMLTAKIGGGEWKLAAVADDALITHAGVSCRFNEDWGLSRNVEHFAERLNARFDREFRKALQNRNGEFVDVNRYVTLGDAGPLWYRPSLNTLLKNGPKQVFGHTPSMYYNGFDRRQFREGGMYFIDPYARGTEGNTDHFKYAVVENGEITVHEYESEESETHAGVKEEV